MRVLQPDLVRSTAHRTRRTVILRSSYHRPTERTRHPVAAVRAVASAHGQVLVGADDHDELDRRYDAIREMLHFEIEH